MIFPQFRIQVLLPVLLILANLPVVSAQQSTRAILLRGNEQRSGIPAFGENAFTGLYGEYVLEMQSGGTIAQRGPLFYVWVSREPHVLPPEDWSIWDEDAQIYGKTEGDTLFITTILGVEGTGSRMRRVLLSFPKETLESLGSRGVNPLIHSWIARFTYFYFLTETETQMSLPAVVNF